MENVPLCRASTSPLPGGTRGSWVGSLFPSILSLKHPHTGESGAEGSLPPLLAILRFALEAPFLHHVAACRWVVLTDPPPLTSV